MFRITDNTHFSLLHTLSMAGIAAALLLSVSCSWTETEALEFRNTPRWERDGWDGYCSALKEYKSGRHKLAYGIFNNSPVLAGAEKDFLRSLPDSLDYVSLTDSDGISDADIEDISILHQKGIKLLFRVDYADRKDIDMKDKAAVEEYLTFAARRVRELGLDGFSFTGNPSMGDPSAETSARHLIESLLAVKGEGQLLVFEGNPLFVPSALRSKIDYYVLATEELKSIAEIEREISSATGYIGLPARKILVSSMAGAALNDGSGAEVSSITVVAGIVRRQGSLAGLAVHDIGADYHNSFRNYDNTRSAINDLNK